MNLFTIGFTQKSAKQFFTLIRENKIDLLLDIRLNNKSQLAGFTKGDDLAYFLEEICQCKYKHCLEFAPTKEIMDDYKKNLIVHDEFVKRYTSLMEQRGNYLHFVHEYEEHTNICLLCSEPGPEYCHRKIIAQMIGDSVPVKIAIEHI